MGWDIHLSVLSVSGELNNELNPLYGESSKTENRVLTMADAMALQEMAKKG